MSQFKKFWAPVATIVGAVLLFYSLIQAFNGNRTLVIGLLILVSLLVFAGGVWNYAFAKSTIPGIPRYKFHWVAKILLVVISLVIIFTALYLLIIIGVIPDRYARIATPTATPTFTPTSSPTSTNIPTFTPTPISAKAYYYMIVLDASRKMDVPFGDGTQTKWNAALSSVRKIINAGNPLANYGLVVVGGQGENDTRNPCDLPSAPLIPFTSPEGYLLPGNEFPRQAVLDQLDGLLPSGDGSFDDAFILAKNQLQNLPPGTIKTLLYVTGASDTCESEDEWSALSMILHISGDVSSFREVIVLAEKVSPELEAFADTIEKLDAINVQVAQNQQQLDQSITVALTEMEAGANEQAAAMVTGQPLSATVTPRTTSTSTRTPTLGPSPLPTQTPLPSTPTQTRLPIATSQPSVELMFNSYIGTGIGCHVSLTLQISGGTAAGSFHVWNASYPAAGDVYPPTTYPIGDTSNFDITLGGDQPAYYSHNVWFEFSGGSSNTLYGLQCPGVP